MWSLSLSLGSVFIIQSTDVFHNKKQSLANPIKRLKHSVEIVPTEKVKLKIIYASIYETLISLLALSLSFTIATIKNFRIEEVAGINVIKRFRPVAEATIPSTVSHYKFSVTRWLDYLFNNSAMYIQQCRFAQ